MKSNITLFLCLLIVSIGIGQTDEALINSQTQSNERTQQLTQLYEEGRILEITGTAAQIEANRLAIRAAWNLVNPDIANYYKPTDNSGLLPETEANLAINGIYYPDVIHEPRVLQTNRDWGVDNLLLDDFIDGGVDIEVNDSGHIYISAYQNNIDFGGMFDIIFIYRSLDGGATFNQWQAANVTAPVRKLELISMYGTGDEYILTYLTTDSGNFQAWRWNTSNGDFDAQVVSGDVVDFSVDRNYPINTSSQRVFATYLKDVACTTEVHSARSTAGSYGFDWVDEVSIDNVCGQQIDMAYGLNGSIYAVYTGASTGNLYNNVNSDYNDPASWTARETIETGANRETLNPTIAAARNALASDKVIIWASDRAGGSADNFDGVGYLRENMGAFGVFSNFGSGGSNWNVAHTDSWVRKINGNEIMRTAYVRDNIDNSGFDLNRSLTFNGTAFDTFEPVADADVNVFDGFPSATAETIDMLPCMAFAGTSAGGNFGRGLYFDAKTEIILGANDNLIDGFTFYPNPAQDIVNVIAQNNIDKIVMYSISGMKVAEYTPQATNTQINISTLSSGVYVMSVTSNGQKGNYKVIVN